MSCLEPEGFDTWIQSLTPIPQSRYLNTVILSAPINTQYLKKCFKNDGKNVKYFTYSMTRSTTEGRQRRQVLLNMKNSVSKSVLHNAVMQYTTHVLTTIHVTAKSQIGAFRIRTDNWRPLCTLLIHNHQFLRWHCNREGCNYKLPALELIKFATLHIYRKDGSGRTCSTDNWLKERGHFLFFQYYVTKMAGRTHNFYFSIAHIFLTPQNLF